MATADIARESPVLIGMALPPDREVEQSVWHRIHEVQTMLDPEDSVGPGVHIALSEEYQETGSDSAQKRRVMLTLVPDPVSGQKGMRKYASVRMPLSEFLQQKEAGSYMLDATLYRAGTTRKAVALAVNRWIRPRDNEPVVPWITDEDRKRPYIGELVKRGTYEIPLSETVKAFVHLHLFETSDTDLKDGLVSEKKWHQRITVNICEKVDPATHKGKPYNRIRLKNGQKLEPFTVSRDAWGDQEDELREQLKQDVPQFAASIDHVVDRSNELIHRFFPGRSGT